MAIKNNIADIRTDYRMKTLSENEVDANPIKQFSQWWDEAIASQVEEANAMTLATVSATGEPSARIMLLKTFDENGFMFFTNYKSNKSHDLDENPKAVLCFFWRELQRQVRINGTVKRASDKDNDTYFQSRPVGSRIGAWASPQSSVIENKSILEINVDKYTQQFGDNVPRPEHWGGYIVVPTVIEFWQGGGSRLHDRVRYTLVNGLWKIERLAP